MPVFQGGRNRANLKAAQARFEQSVAAYRGQVLTAFREVEDSLSDLSTLASQGEAVNRALVSARDTATLANERYQQGLSSYLEGPEPSSGQAASRPPLDRGTGIKALDPFFDKNCCSPFSHGRWAQCHRHRSSQPPPKKPGGWVRGWVGTGTGCGQ